MRIKLLQILDDFLVALKDFYPNLNYEEVKEMVKNTSIKLADARILELREYLNRDSTKDERKQARRVLDKDAGEEKIKNHFTKGR